MPAGNEVISVVVPAFNEADCLATLHAELSRVCDWLPYAFEFLFIDDGSTDASVAVLQQLRRRDVRVAYLVLAANSGHQAALSAGLAYATGDAVITMDADLQHPPSLIPELLAHWRAGADVVSTRRLSTDGISFGKRFTSSLFYRLFNLIGRGYLAPGSADFRLLSRRALQMINAVPERHRFLRGLVAGLKVRQTSVDFHAGRRYAGMPKVTFWGNVRLALDGLCGVQQPSTLPLYVVREAVGIGQTIPQCLRLAG